MRRLIMSLLTRAVTTSVGVLVPAGPLSAADVEIIVRYGTGEPVSEFKSAVPPGAVTSFERLDSRSRLRLGGGTGHILSFSTGGMIVPQGIRVEADLRKIFALGRVTRVNGVSIGGEITSVDLQVALTVVKPAGVDEPLVVTLPLRVDTTSTVAFPDGTVWGLQIRVGFPATLPSVEFTVGGAKYKLRLIGFGSVGADGVFATIGALVDDPVQSADLLAVVERPCPDREEALSQFIVLTRNCNRDNLGTSLPATATSASAPSSRPTRATRSRWNASPGEGIRSTRCSSRRRAGFRGGSAGARSRPAATR